MLKKLLALALLLVVIITVCCFLPSCHKDSEASTEAFSECITTLTEENDTIETTEEPTEPSFDTSSENLTEEPTADPSEVSSEESTEEPFETCTEMITEGMTEEDTEVFTDAVTEPSTPSCSHSFDDWKTVSSASCTTSGERTRACLLCGEEETEPLAPLGHDEVTHEGQAATCTEVGHEAYVTCTRCDYTTYQTLPALGHQEVVSPAVPPAHGTPGLTEGVHCAYCGLVFIEQQPLPPLYALNVVASPDKYGQVSSSQLIGAGTEVTLEAQAEEGYYFFGWLDGNTLISRETKLTLTMGAEDRTVTAFFTATEPVSKNVWNGDVAQGFSGGTGTANDPYMISSGAELAYLAELAHNGQANKYYELANDIDLGGLEWMPIGIGLDMKESLSSRCAFGGHFDGAGYTVHHFKITAPVMNTPYIGLFGQVSGGIQNLGVRDFIIEVDLRSDYNTMVGGLVGQLFESGSVESCYAIGEIRVSPSEERELYVGGLVGCSQSLISESFAAVELTVTAPEVFFTRPHVGGLAGYLEFKGMIQNSFAAGNIYINGFGKGDYKADGLVPYAMFDDSVVNAYYCADGHIFENGQPVGHSESIYSACTYADLSRTDFYTDTLAWDADQWQLTTLSPSEGKYPHIRLEYVQVIIEATHGGQVTLEESIVRVGQSLTVQAIPDMACQFLGWYRGDAQISTAIAYTYKPSGSDKLTARFDHIDYTVNLTCNQEGVEMSGGGAYHYLDVVTLYAPESEDYAFLGWYCGETLISETATYSFEMPMEDLTYEARYLPLVMLDARPNASSFGTCTAGKRAYGGEYVSLTAEPFEGYTFVGWFDGNLCVSREAVYSFYMPDDDVSLVAGFTATQNLLWDIWDGSIAEGFVDGRGTAEDPYLISTGAELAFFAHVINDRVGRYYNQHYRLVNDIDLGGLAWEPIGSATKAFTGTFHGDGFVISNFVITSSEDATGNNFGLFGYVEGTIENLGIENFSIHTAGKAGGLVGYLYRGTVRNCYAKNGEISAYTAGGLVGYGEKCTIETSYADCTVQASREAPENVNNITVYAGGLIGYLNGQVVNCYSLGDVTAIISGMSNYPCAYAGGLVGTQYDGNVTNAYAAGNVTALAPKSAKYSKAYAYGLAASATNGVALGHVTAEGYSCFVSAVTGGKTNVYGFEGQQLTKNGEPYTDRSATLLPMETLEGLTFFTETLTWSSEIWNMAYRPLQSGCLLTLSICDQLFALYEQVFVTSLGGGTVNYTDLLCRHTTVPLMALPNAGCRLVGWYINDQLVSSEETFLYTPTGSVQITAVFEIIDYSITLTPSVEGLDCLSGSGTGYHYGDDITINAKTVDGYAFLGWYIDGALYAAEQTVSFSMPARDLTLEARYYPYYDLSVKSNEDSFGLVTGGWDMAYETQCVTVSAAPNEGYVFFGWFADGVLLCEDPTYTFCMPPQDFELIARFTSRISIPGEPWDGKPAIGFSGGRGTAEDPYLISSPGELAFLSLVLQDYASKSLYSHQYYQLTCSLDLGGHEWTSIGFTEGKNGTPFAGHFDGNGYTIANFKPAMANNGLFGDLEGTIKNVRVENFDIFFDGDRGYVGGLVGYNNGGTISNCSVVGKASGQYGYFGGLVGFNLGTITDSYAWITADDISFAGGLVGYNGGTIQRCYARTEMTSQKKIGGLAVLNEGTITDCRADVSLTASDKDASSNTKATLWIAGLVVENRGLVSRSEAFGEIYATNYGYVGGLVGYNRVFNHEIGIVQNCKADVQITVDYCSYTGGLVGYNASTITESYAMGKLYMPTYHKYGTYDSETALGGLVGCHAQGEITDCFATDDVGGASQYLGGLIGINESAVLRCYASGKVYSTARPESKQQLLAGLVAMNRGSLSDCLAMGDVIHPYAALSDLVGPVVSYFNPLGSITNCYRSDDQIIEADSTLAKIDENGILVSAKQLSSPEFYMTSLFWSKEVWQLQQVDGDQLPGLDHQPVTYHQVWVSPAIGGATNLSEAIVHKNGTAVLIAIPDTGYAFIGWYMNGMLISNQRIFEMAITEDVSMTPVFERSAYSVTVFPTYEGIAHITGQGDAYGLGDSVTLTATEAEGYAFLGWYSKNRQLSDAMFYTFSMPAAGVIIEARYAKYYDLTVAPNDEAQGTVITVDAGYEGQSVTVSAVPMDGYVFDGWYVGDKSVSRQMEYTFIMPSDHYSLVAVFISKELARETDIWDGSIASGFGGGEGTQENPYLIYTGAELAYLSLHISEYGDKCFRLMNDIDLNGLVWTPIGYTYSAFEYPFSGYFDGNGHVIYHLTIRDSVPREQGGLFGFSKGYIINLGLEDCDVAHSRLTKSNDFGCLVGRNHGTVVDCYATGSITLSTNISNANGDGEFYAGGLVGQNRGYVHNTYANVGISIMNQLYNQYRYSNFVAGGLVGYNEGEVADSFAWGEVTNKTLYAQTYAGGLVGINAKEGKITRCFAHGGVGAYALYQERNPGAYAGGLVATNMGSIADCYATGDVTGETHGSFQYIADHVYAGGLIGSSTGTVVNCYALGDVNGSVYDDVYVGGLIGRAYDASIKNCFAFGNVTGSYGYSDFVYCYGIGGLIGEQENSEVENCYRYEGQKLVKSCGHAISLPGEDHVTEITLDQYDDSDFYTDLLGWDSGVWKINGLCLEEGYGPVLIRQK